MKPEEAARRNIDVMLAAAGWLVQDVAQMNVHASRGAAIRDLPLGSFGYADYALYVDDRPTAVIEAKKEGTPLAGVEVQPEKYGLDLLGAVLRDIRHADPDSDRFDGALLRRVSLFKRALDAGVRELHVEDRYQRDIPEAVVSEETVSAATKLLRRTPRPRAVRVVGKLDMVRLSTQAFALRLDDGSETTGVLMADRADDLARLLGRRVAVSGRAIYRPSGRPLRLDAEVVEESSDTSPVFARVPPPLERSFRASEARKPQDGRRGVAAFFGTWPGDESEEEILAALAELS